MHFTTLELLTISSAVLSHAAPFQIQDGELQRHRRRAVDYPVNFIDQPKPARRLRKREAASYSVVQVDGESTSTAAPTQPPATITVTQAGSTPSALTQTVLLTSVIPGPTSDETVVITTTQEVTEVSTAVTTAPAQVTTSGVAGASSAASPVTVTAVSVSTASADFAAQMSASVLTSDSTDTLIQTVTSMVTAATPTAYYDDGLWHTYYPIKSFVPPPVAASSSTVDAQAISTAASPQLGLNNGSSAPAAYSSAGSSGSATHARRWQTATPAGYPSQSPAAYPDKWTHAKRNDAAAYSPVAYPHQTPAASASKWTHAKRNEAAYNPIAYPSQTPAASPSKWTPAKRSEAAYTPTPVASADQSPEAMHHSGAAYVPRRFPKQARKAPVDLKTANWNVTRTEMTGMQRFKA